MRETNVFDINMRKFKSKVLIISIHKCDYWNKTSQSCEMKKKICLHIYIFSIFLIRDLMRL